MPPNSSESTQTAGEPQIGRMRRSKIPSRDWRGPGERTLFSLGVRGRSSEQLGAGVYLSGADSVLHTLEQAVSGREYLVGDRFTAADVYVASHLGWGMMFGSIDKRPAFVRSHERFQSRPAVQRARELDEALMPAQPQSPAAA